MRAVGVDLGGTKIQTVVVDLAEVAAVRAGDPVDPVALVKASSRRLTPDSGGADTVCAAVVETVRAVGLDDVAAVGVGVPGPVEADSGTVLRAPNLAHFGERVPMAAILRDALGVAVVVDNDVNVAVFGEHRLGAGRGCSDMLGVWCGTGIGGGLVLDGRLRRGHHGYAGEVGHMVVKMGGRKPPEGVEGSIEAYAGRASMEHQARQRAAKGHHTLLPRIARERGRENFTSGVFHRAVRKGDELATELVGDAVAALGAGIASVQNLLDLDRVVLGGGVADSFGLPFVADVAAAMGPCLIAPDFAPEVVLDQLGDFAGALGAAVLGGESAAAR